MLIPSVINSLQVNRSSTINTEGMTAITSECQCYTIIYKFLVHCQELHTSLNSEGGCKLAVMPGLLILWKGRGVLAFSFFSRDSLPHKWTQYTTDKTFVPVKEIMIEVVNLPWIPPILNYCDDDGVIQTAWYSPIDHTMVAYITTDDIIHLLLEPIWFIPTSREMWQPLPKEADKRMVNVKCATTTCTCTHSLGEAFVVCHHRESRWSRGGGRVVEAIAVFQRDSPLNQASLPPLLPFHYLSSTMWGIPLMNLATNEK